MSFLKLSLGLQRRNRIVSNSVCCPPSKHTLLLSLPAFLLVPLNAGFAQCGNVGSSCTTDEQCDDGIFCSGQEFCDNGTCACGPPPDCNDGITCTIFIGCGTFPELCIVDDCIIIPLNPSCEGFQSCNNGVETCDPDHPDADPTTGCVCVAPPDDAPFQTIFGYLPATVAGDPNWVSLIQWDKLTHVACFALDINAQGDITAHNGWPWTSVIDTAHANNVKVQPVFKLHDCSAINTLLTTPANRQNLINNIRGAIIAGNADGVNINFECFGVSNWAQQMADFLTELSIDLKAENPQWEVTVAGPALVAGTGWDLSATAAACDGIFIMGYDFYGSWSETTGPSAPLTGGSINVTNTILVEYAEVVQTIPEKLILGVPYYGNQWITPTADPYAPVNPGDWQGARTFAQAVLIDAAEEGAVVQWDENSQTPWIVWHDGANWRQTWFDNADSLALKYELAKDHGLQGVGMWALGFDGARPELWNLLQEMFGSGCESPPSPPDLGGDLCDGGDGAGLPCSNHAGCPGGVCGLKNRGITITPSVGAARGGSPLSVQVCIAAMPQFPARVGECWWAGPEITIPNAPSPPLAGAFLECTSTPHAQEWTSGPLHLLGAAIVPDSTYEVRICNDTGTVCSDPLLVGTGKWADVVAPFGAGQPNFSDISAIISKFAATVGSVDLPRADLIGTMQPDGSNVPDLSINFADVSQAIGAFGGASYPATVPTCP